MAGVAPNALIWVKFGATIFQLGLSVLVIVLVRFRLQNGTDVDGCLLAPALEWSEACVFADVVASVSILFTFMVSIMQLYVTHKELGTHSNSSSSSSRITAVRSSGKRLCGIQFHTLQLTILCFAVVWWAVAAAVLTNFGVRADEDGLGYSSLRVAVVASCWVSMVLFVLLAVLEWQQRGARHRTTPPVTGSSQSNGAGSVIINGTSSSRPPVLPVQQLSLPTAHTLQFSLRSSSYPGYPGPPVMGAPAAAAGGGGGGVAIGVPVVQLTPLPTEAAAASGSGAVSGMTVGRPATVSGSFSAPLPLPPGDQQQQQQQQQCQAQHQVLQQQLSQSYSLSGGPQGNLGAPTGPPASIGTAAGLLSAGAAAFGGVVVPGLPAVPHPPRTVVRYASSDRFGGPASTGVYINGREVGRGGSLLDRSPFRLTAGEQHSSSSSGNFSSGNSFSDDAPLQQPASAPAVVARHRDAA